MNKLDTMNHEQRARFARSLYRRPALPRNIATKLFLERLAGGALKRIAAAAAAEVEG